MNQPGYRCVLVYTIQHDEYGTVENQTIPFAREASAHEWLRAVERNRQRGLLPYEVRSYTIERFA